MYKTFMFRVNKRRSNKRKRRITVPKRRLQSTDQKSDTTIEMEGYLGICDITNQIRRRSTNSFQFTLMVLGQSGLGKSTLIDSLFACDAFGNKHSVPLELAKKYHIEERFYSLTENGVNLNLTIVCTPGYGDSIDNSDCWTPIIQYIDKQQADYFEQDIVINRAKPFSDRRVHCCLYFINPRNGLTELDITALKQLHKLVNIIPIIAKADTMTAEESKSFKESISAKLKSHNITVYDFPDSEFDDAESEIQKLKDRQPFAVVGSKDLLNVDGKFVRGRSYPWGVVEVDNLQHNDFTALRRLLMTYLMDICDVTHHCHYQTYRFEKVKDLDICEIVGLSELDKIEIAEHKEQNQSIEEQILAFYQTKKIELEKLLQEERDAFDKKEKEFYVDIDRLTSHLIAKNTEFAKEKLKFETDHKHFTNIEDDVNCSVMIPPVDRVGGTRPVTIKTQSNSFAKRALSIYRR